MSKVTLITKRKKLRIKLSENLFLLVFTSALIFCLFSIGMLTKTPQKILSIREEIVSLENQINILSRIFIQPIVTEKDRQQLLEKYSILLNDILSKRLLDKKEAETLLKIYEQLSVKELDEKEYRYLSQKYEALLEKKSQNKEDLTQKLEELKSREKTYGTLTVIVSFIGGFSFVRYLDYKSYSII